MRAMTGKLLDGPLRMLAESADASITAAWVNCAVAGCGPAVPAAAGRSEAITAGVGISPFGSRLGPLPSKNRPPASKAATTHAATTTGMVQLFPRGGGAAGAVRGAGPAVA